MNRLSKVDKFKWLSLRSFGGRANYREFPKFVRMYVSGDPEILKYRRVYLLFSRIGKGSGVLMLAAFSAFFIIFAVQML